MPRNFARGSLKRGSGIEQACAVDMYGHVIGARNFMHRGHMRERQHCAAGSVVRIFHPD